MDKQGVIERLEEISKRLSITSRVIEDMPELPGVELTAGQTGIHVNLPYDMGRLAEVRCLLGATWQPASDYARNVLYNEDNGAMYRYYRHNEYSWLALYIGLNPDRAGSKCRLEQVDEITKPVYQAICE